MPVVGWVILALLVLILLWAVAAYNSLVRLRNDTDEAYSTMDVYLKKRYDLIPNLVETVKGYAKHEAATLENVIKARNMGVQAGTAAEKFQAENALTGTLRTLFAVAESYPDLKANQNFIDLQNQLKKVEEDIANSRRYYNAVAKSYNIKTEVFPSSIIASAFHFIRKELFEISGEQRENVKVQF